MRTTELLSGPPVKEPESLTDGELLSFFTLSISSSNQIELPVSKAYCLTPTHLTRSSIHLTLWSWSPEHIRESPLMCSPGKTIATPNHQKVSLLSHLPKCTSPTRATWPKPPPHSLSDDIGINSPVKISTPPKNIRLVMRPQVPGSPSLQTGNA